MKVLMEISLDLVLDDCIQHYTPQELEALYDCLDEACVKIEREMIENGIWEDD
jgi:hypothetical protein